MDVVLGRERTRQSQVIKQADVVALLGLLPGSSVAMPRRRISFTTSLAATTAAR
jgi:trehalose/maltose hydrolase-like predicted phosphorylase